LIPDVNLDQRIDQLDLDAVTASPYWTLGNVSLCPIDPSTQQRNCGRADVNRDGSVDIQDQISITQSSFLGSDVSCGAVYSTMFSCGSTRSAPITPALAISLDSIVYFDQTGLDGVEGTLTHAKRAVRARMESLDHQILSELEYLNSQDDRLAHAAKLEEEALNKELSIAPPMEEPKSLLIEVLMSIGAVVMSGLVAIFVFRR
jgi:hypothetical protein